MKNPTDDKIKSVALEDDETTLNILFTEYCGYCISFESNTTTIKDPLNSQEEIDAQRKLTREEFERVLKEEYDPEKNEFKNNFNLGLALTVILMRHTEFIKQLQLNKEDGTSNKFDSCSSRSSPALSNSELEKVKSLPHKQAQDIHNTLEESFRDFSSSIMSGLKFNKQPDSSTPPIPLINQFSVTLDSIVKSFSKTGNGNGLFENINSNPIPLASEGHPFQIPQPWLTGSESLQSWFSSTTTSLFTSIPKSAKQNQEPNKQEPYSGDDHNLQQKIRKSVIKNLGQRRSTPPPNQKPPSPEAAKEASLRAKEASQKAPPTAQMRRTRSAHPGPARDAPPPPFKRANSIPSQKPGPKDPRIAFFGKGTKRHREHPKSTHPDAKIRKAGRPEANGPRNSTASSLDPKPSKKPRTK